MYPPFFPGPQLGAHEVNDRYFQTAQLCRKTQVYIGKINQDGQVGLGIVGDIVGLAFNGLDVGRQFVRVEQKAKVRLESTPELGSLRFIAPKDTDDEVRALIKERGVEGSYPELERRGILSPALHMKAGDATVHGSATMHSAPPNKTDRVRWAYIVSVFPAQTKFTGNHFWPSEGVEGVTKGEAFPDHRYPVLA